ncbi:MAG: CHAT domain-containing tetratricopeptide repeat protein, partial [Candidatus Rhabdochlamydia sp.]
HLKIALELGDRFSEGNAYGHLGIAYNELGEYRKAMAYHEEHLKIALELGDRFSEGNAYANIGNIHYELGDYQKALSYYQNDLNIALELKNLIKEERAYNNLGIAYNKLGKYEQAILYHQKSLMIASDQDDPMAQAKAHSNLGLAHYADKDYEAAITHYEISLNIALKIKNSWLQGMCYHGLGLVYYGLKDYEAAIMHYENSLKIALKLGDHIVAGKAYNNLGHIYSELKDYGLSKKYFRKSMLIKESLLNQVDKSKWKISLFEQVSSSYPGLEEVLLKQGNIYEALRVSDMRRAPALSSLISQKLISKNHQDIHLKSLTPQEMIGLAKKLHTTLIMYSLIFMNSEEPSLQVWVISSETKPIQRITLAIPEDGSLNPDQIFNKFPYVTAIKRPQRKNQWALKEDNFSTQHFDKTLSSWYNSLIAPLEAYLPAKNLGKTVTFIPDGFLAHLPFGAFYNQKEDRYLIENYPISVAPSIKVLSLLDQFSEEPLEKALLIGNPVTPIARNNNLSKTEQEVRDVIAPMMKHLQMQVNVHLQKEATPIQILNQTEAIRVLHIACHGDTHQPISENLYPHSVFDGVFRLASDEKSLGGQLHAEEIALMSLKADLVFISACHLGRGNLKKEGSVGPVWSFLGAGAKSTIASYWPLPEGDTTVKMVETFYKHYLGKDTPQLNKAKALQQAVLEVMKTKRHKPRQWGALFLSGMIETKALLSPMSP